MWIRKNLKWLLLMISAVVVVAGMLLHAQPGKTQASSSPLPSDWTVSAPGRVEPISEDVKVGSELNGKLKRIYVEEGDIVRRGQLLAELVNADYQAQVQAYEAAVKEREAELRKTINGALRQERGEALSQVRQQEAVMNQAKAEMERRQQLFEAGVISREEAERYARDYDVARARYEETREHSLVVDRDAREEDRAMAEANLAAARAQLALARATLEKTCIRSPIDGTLMKRHHRAGESISVYAASPDAIFTLGDKRRLRVRVDVDEADVSKLRVGQRAWVTADAYGDKRFWGRVVRIGEQMGRKNIRTEEPTEHVDTKILETLVELDPGQPLPAGLRVSAFIKSDVR